MSTPTGSASPGQPWIAYAAACEEARRRGDHRVGTEHLLLGLLHDPAVASALRVSLEQARRGQAALDQLALESIGLSIRLDAPLPDERQLPSRPSLRSAFTDRVKLTPAAKHAMSTAAHHLRRTRRRASRRVILAELNARLARDLLECQPPDPAAALLDILDVDRATAGEALRAASND